MAKFEIKKATRHRREYGADLFVNGIKVGRVERAQSGKGGGMGSGNYIATVDGIKVALGRTLADVRDDLREWVADEELLEEDAVWLRKKREQHAALRASNSALNRFFFGS